MNNLLIVGGGEHGRVVKEMASEFYRKIDFLDDKAEDAVGKFADYLNFTQDYRYAFVALGNTTLRAEWLDKLQKAGYEIPVIIHPFAYVNVTWSSWSIVEIFDLAATGGSRTETPIYAPGLYMQYGVWTIDAFDLYSSERISNSIFCAVTVCSAPTSCTLSASLAENNVTLSWSGASGGVGNAISSYEIEYCDSSNNSTWGSWTTLSVVVNTGASGTLSVSPPSIRGNYRKFRILTRGTIGIIGYSGWKESSGSVRKNRLPQAPVVSAPKDESFTYSTSPRFLITTGIEPDGQTQIVEVKIDSGAWKNSVNNPELFSVSGELSDNESTIYMDGPLSNGSHTITIQCIDSGTEAPSPEVIRTFTILASPFEVIVANETKVKAEHIKSIRTVLNNIRGYYGLTAISWEENIIAGKTYVKNWPLHILELRAVIDSIINHIDLFDAVTDFDIPEVVWLAIGTGRPKATVISQLYDVVLIL